MMGLAWPKRCIGDAKSHHENGGDVHSASTMARDERVRHYYWLKQRVGGRHHVHTLSQ
jgi:hypothetical protein